MHAARSSSFEDENEKDYDQSSFNLFNPFN